MSDQPQDLPTAGAGPVGGSLTGSLGAGPLILRTRTTEHHLAPTPTGTGVRALWWGPTGGDVRTPVDAHAPSFATAEDLFPHEFSVAGTRQVRASDLLVHDDAQHAGARVHLDGTPELISDGTGDHLTVRLVDAAGDLAVTLTWRTSREHDVIVRTAAVHNRSADRTLHLVRAAAGAFCVHLPDGADLATLTGDWCREFTPRTTRLTCGTFSLGSRQGITSHRAAPVVTLTDPADPGRGAWSVALAAPGSWGLEVDLEDSEGWVRVSAGDVGPESPVMLEPGRTYETPELLGLWAPDPDAAARAWHRYARLALLRDTSAEHRPLTYNSWYSTGFDVRADQQLSLAEQAAALGCEEFVLDDGWLRGRADDTAGLGDWDADPAAFPRGLAELADGVHALGMRFGLWIEPEGVNPDSDLYRAHPDWIHRAPDREPVTIRHQHVLDLGRPEVEEWCRDLLRRVLGSASIDHLKWDMNRAITDGGRDGDPHAREWAQRHAAAYHRLLATLRAEFPHVTLEACSGGGGRIDASVLAASDVVWPSDETGPRDRLEIQHGFLTAYPAAVMSSWVTAHDGQRDPRPAPLTYRMAVAMCGVPGLGMDLAALTDAERDRLRELVAVAKDVRPLVLDGEVQRHGSPRAHGYAVEYAQVEGECTAPGGVTDRRVALMVFAAPEGQGSPVRLRPRFATPAGHPHVVVATGGRGAADWDGEDLVVRIDPEHEAAVLLLDA